MNNARSGDGLVHDVVFDDNGDREYGQLRCGPWFYWMYSPVDDVPRAGVADPVNPTKEKVTCLMCLGSA